MGIPGVPSPFPFLILPRQTSWEMSELTFTTTSLLFPQIYSRPHCSTEPACIKVTVDLHVTKSKTLSDSSVLGLSGASETAGQSPSNVSLPWPQEHNAGTPTHTHPVLSFSSLWPSSFSVSATGFPVLFSGNLSHANDPFLFIVQLFLKQWLQGRSILHLPAA